MSAHREIAHTCTTYLMFMCFDLKLAEADLDAVLLKGHCNLQAYATSHWLFHVKEGIQDEMEASEFDHLCEKISAFLARRTNPNFDRKKADKEKPRDVEELTPLLQKRRKHIYESLCIIDSK